MGKNPLKDLSKMIEESKQRWAEIEVHKKMIEEDNSEYHSVKEAHLANLVLLLVEHLRPLYSVQDQNLNIDAVVKNLLKSR